MHGLCWLASLTTDKIMPRISTVNNTLKATNYVFRSTLWTREFRTATGFYVGGPASSFLTGDCVVSTGNNGGTWQFARLSQTGAVLWNKTLTGSYDFIEGMVLDRQDNLIIGVKTSSTTGSIVKFDKDLNKLWERTFPGGPVGSVTDLTTDISGNIYVAGVVTISDVYYIQLLKINSSGTLQWARRFNPTGGGNAFGAYIRISFSESNFYLLLSDHRPTSDLNDSGMILVKGDTATGNVTWAKVYRSTTTANQRAEYSYGFTLDTSENPILAGIWSQVTNFDIRPDFLVAKFDSSGNLSYQRRIGFFTSSGFEREGMNQGGGSQNCVTHDSSGNIYVVGSWHQRRSAVIKINSTFTDIKTKLFESNAGGQNNQILFSADMSGNLYVAGSTATTYRQFVAQLPNTTLRSAPPTAFSDVSPTIVDPAIEVTDLSSSTMTDSGTTLSETTNFSLTSGTIEFLALSKLFSLPSQVRLRPGD